MLQTEVLILGGGLVGGMLATLLKHQNVPFILVDPDSPERMVESVSDGRTTAVSLGSKRIFEKANLWNAQLHEQAECIKSIRVLDFGSVWSVDFDHSDISCDPMGYIVQNMHLRQVILDNLKDDSNVFYNASVANLEKNDSFVEATLSNGTIVRSKLLVSAEGKKSPSRSLISPQIKSRDYGQNALVVHLTHAEPHNHHAWEIFTPQGPFAILPLKDENLKKSGIVFCRPASYKWDDLSDADLADEVCKIFPYYGALKVDSKRWQFPLSVFELDKIIGHRQVLIGDAAHSMHPIAGQGVNLGWRDADTLCEKITESYRLGLDIGSDILLKSYSRARKLDTKVLTTATDLMNQLFSNNSKTLHFVRNAGFAIVNQINPLKRFFMKKAMGL